MEKFSKNLGKDSEYGRKIDICLKDLVVKTGAGILVGGLASLLFKRKAWPITLGGGVGIGMAYTACENRFRRALDKNVNYNVCEEKALPAVFDDGIILAPDLSSTIKTEKPSE